MDSVLEAFSVEPLNKQFYSDIQKYFYSLIGGKVESNHHTQEYKSILSLPSLDIQKNRKTYQEFAVRLIGRIIFVWFLKNKSSDKGLPLIPRDWLSSARVCETRDYYHTLLEKLFFEILNKPIEKRINELPQGHESIPFLNGGLFEPQNDDYYERGDGGFSKFINTLKIPDTWFENFFATLEQFNFTIDENSLNDQEVSIDPEMLGRIFENLLAEIDPDTEKSARKATGSFYTPREIVDYMVTESLVSYLQAETSVDEKTLRILFAEKLFAEDDDDDFNFSNFEHRDKLLNAFDQIKILDPACGSGAFPMGIVRKINTALQKLDPDASIWKKKQLNKIDNAAFKQEIEDKLDKSNVEYIRKLGIIQHSIYGVDIQPIATEISKLRSFLSLVVDENIRDDAPNRGIYPLPNLEFKFVTADTLIGLQEEKDQQSINFGGVNEHLRQLQEIRNDYLQAYGKEKEKLKGEFLSRQRQIAKKDLAALGYNQKALQIIGWDPFSHAKSDWFEPEWMFGVKAFDVVIGNPPYVQLQKAFDHTRKFADLYKDEKYQTFERTGDIYALFYERGLNLLSDKGLLCFITSNKWMRANYGKSLRRFFAQQNPQILIDLGPGVFSSATVDTNILLIQKNSPLKEGVNTPSLRDTPLKEGNLLALTLTDNTKINNLSDDDFTVLANIGEESWIILSPAEQRIKGKIERIGTPLKDWDISINYGIKIGYNEAFIIDGKTKDKLIAKDPKSAEILKPILRGRDIKRYKAEFADLWLINSHNGYTSHSPLQEGWTVKQDGVFKKYKSLPYNPKLKERAKALRKAGNLSEVLFWNKVKRKQFLGLDFHRQKIIGNYIVDFYCPELDLVVEIDGSSHDDKIEYDKNRDEYLNSLGLTVFHIKDSRVKKELADVLHELEGVCLGNTPPADAGAPLQEGNYIPPIDINDYPAIKEHLDKYWNKIKVRQDKGNTPYNLRNCAYLEEFEKEKIVYREISAEMNAVYDNLDYFTNNKLYIITGTMLKFLLSVFNSKLFNNFLLLQANLTGGKGADFLEQIPIPKIPESDQKPFATLVDVIIDKKERGEDTTAEEREIDRMVYELYGLTEDEIAIVEGGG